MTAAAKERPILFSGPMVRAILDGRKTQTRRIVKFPKWLASADGGQALEMPYQGDGFQDMRKVTAADVAANCVCPYGQPGERLWVRECVARAEAENGNELIVYKADMAIYDVYQLDDGPKELNGFRGEYWTEINGRLRFTPSIHMPRWASRILLEITDVRVERLNEISDLDCVAEGIWSATEADDSLIDMAVRLYGAIDRAVSVRDYFRVLWDRINAKRGFGWDANPWVWAITFKRIEAQQ